MNLSPSYICLFVVDIERSVEFYTTVLGLTPIPNLTTPHFRAFEFGSLVLGLERNGSGAVGEKDKTQNPILLQFKSSSVEELKNHTEQLREHGARIIQDCITHSFGTVTSFLDPDGNRLELLHQ